MSHQTWQELLVAAFVDGTAVTGTSEASALPGQGKYTIPANVLDYGGKKLRVRAGGRMSNVVTTPGTLTLKLKMGPTSTIIGWNSGAIPLNTTAKTNVTWLLDAEFDVRTIGSGTAAAMLGIGVFTSESVQGAAAGTALACLCPATAPAAGTGFDTTVANLVDLTATFSVTGNSFQVHQYALESSN